MCEIVRKVSSHAYDEDPARFVDDEVTSPNVVEAKALRRCKRRLDELVVAVNSDCLVVVMMEVY